jgi:hypothetical protein
LKGWPTDAAEDYGDKVFGAMMFAKVLCVQLVNHLGYDVLFQDVDVIWYKNPLAFFQERSSDVNSFDLYFQDDGARSNRYVFCFYFFNKRLSLILLVFLNCKKIYSHVL